MPGPTSYASEACGGGGVIGGARGSLARSSFSSLGSGGAGVVQSPPGYDSYGSQSSGAHNLTKYLSSVIFFLF